MFKNLDDKKIKILIIICILINVIVSFAYCNLCDLYTFNFQWIKSLNNYNLFKIYTVQTTQTTIAVDYPPLYIIMLSLIKYPAIYFEQISKTGIFQFIMKLFPLIFYILSTHFLYKKYSPKAALLWCSNIGILINVSMWGQTDIIMLYFTILMFYYIKNKRIEYVGIMFALCCLTKLQGVYLFPIYLLYLVVEKTDFTKKIKSLLYGTFTGIIVWLPFMIGSKNIMLPFNIYFGGFSKYKVINFGASNIYIDFYGKQYNEKIGFISYILLFICIISLILIYRKTKDILLSSALYLFNIYMITFGQHERYGIYSMLIFLLIFIYKKKYLSLYILSSISLAITQIGVLIKENAKIYYEVFTNLQSDEINTIMIKYNNIIFYLCAIGLLLNIITFIKIKKIIKNEKFSTHLE